MESQHEILDYKKNLLQKGKNIIDTNPFYFTLHLLLKYHFVRQEELFLMTFIKDVIKSENEFKVFLVYIQYSIYVYNTNLKNIVTKEDSNDDIVLILVAHVKDTYDKDRRVLCPFITSVHDNEEEVMDKFNIVKSTYEFKIEEKNKFEMLNEAIGYLEKSKALKIESDKYNTKAMNILLNLKTTYNKSLNNIPSPKLLM